MSRRHMHTPMSVQSHHDIGVRCFIEYHHRIHGGNFGSIPAPIKDYAFSQAGYCLDAHELLPSGSMRFERFGPGADEWIAEATTHEREAASTPAPQASEGDAP